MTDSSWEDLSRLYAGQARESLEHWIERLGPGTLSRKDLQEFRIMVHRLRGTGTSFGLPWLTDACAALDNEAAALLKREELPPAEKVLLWRSTLAELSVRLAAS